MVSIRATSEYEGELIEWANDQLGAPVKWGINDCMQLAVSAIDIVLESNFAVEYAGLYDDEASAKAYLEDFDPAGFLIGAGFVELPSLSYARIGDVVLASSDDWDCCAHVCLGSVVLSAQPDERVRTSPKRLLANASNVVG